VYKRQPLNTQIIITILNLIVKENEVF